MSPSKYYSNKQNNMRGYIWNDHSSKTLWIIILKSWELFIIANFTSFMGEPCLSFQVISQITGVKISLSLFPTTLEYETLGGTIHV